MSVFKVTTTEFLKYISCSLPRPSRKSLEMNNSRFLNFAPSRGSSQSQLMFIFRVQCCWEHHFCLFWPTSRFTHPPTCPSLLAQPPYQPLCQQWMRSLLIPGFQPGIGLEINIAIVLLYKNLSEASQEPLVFWLPKDRAKPPFCKLRLTPY